MAETDPEGTFEGIGEPTEEKTLLEPPEEPDFEPDDLEREESIPIDELTEPGSEDLAL